MDAFSDVIHDVITTAHPFSYTAKSMSIGVINNKLDKSDV